jgi:hypothetical protein
LTTRIIGDKEFDVHREALDVIEDVLIRSKVARRAAGVELQFDVCIQQRHCHCPEGVTYPSDDDQLDSWELIFWISYMPIVQGGVRRRCRCIRQAAQNILEALETTRKNVKNTW